MPHHAKKHLLLLALFVFLTTALHATNQALLEKLANGVRAHQERIDVREFNLPIERERLTAIWTEFLDTYPELFHVSKSMRYDYANGIVSTMGPSYYTFNEEQYENLLPRFNEVVETIYDTITYDNPDELAYLLRIYDTLSYHIAYTFPQFFTIPEDLPEPLENQDGSCDTAFTTVGALLYRQAVCEGYSRTLKLFLDKRGIESKILSSETMNHAWNAVKLAGKWYHVDLTWGDHLCMGYVDYEQEPPVIYNTTPQRDFPGNVNHSFLLCNDTEFLEHPRDTHYEWTPALEELGTPGEEFPAAFWKREDGNSVRSLLVKDNAAYFIEHNPETDCRALRKATWNDDGFTVTTVQDELPGKWYVRLIKTEDVGEDDATVTREFHYVTSGILNFDQLLIFHDAISLYGYDLVDGDLFLIDTIGTLESHDYVMGLWQTWDGEPLAHITRDGNHAGKVIQLPQIKELIGTLDRLRAAGYQMASQHFDPASAPVLATDGTPLPAGLGSWLETFYAKTEVIENNEITINIPALPTADEEALVKLELFAEDDTDFTTALATSAAPLREGLTLQYGPEDFSARRLIVRLACTGQTDLVLLDLTASTMARREYLTFKTFPQIHESQWNMIAIPADVTILEQPAERPELFTYDLQMGIWTVVNELVAGRAYWVKDAASSVTVFCSHEPSPAELAPGWQMVAWTDEMTETPFLWNGNSFCILEEHPAFGTPVLLYRPEPAAGDD
ncbi:MAG: hypothetical protein J6Y80_01895 [Victivallales bacterium]|nr:hypothetical protein [Victivallales bacterium]